MDEKKGSTNGWMKKKRKRRNRWMRVNRSLIGLNVLDGKIWRERWWRNNR